MKYDKSNKNEMNDFLQMVYRNTKEYISPVIVSSFLRHYYIKDYELQNFRYEGANNRFLFKIWNKDFKYKDNIYTKLEDNSYFFQILSNEKIEKEEYIKLYIPLDYAHLEEGVRKIFDFID